MPFVWMLITVLMISSAYCSPAFAEPSSTQVSDSTSKVNSLVEDIGYSKQNSKIKLDFKKFKDTFNIKVASNFNNSLSDAPGAVTLFNQQDIKRLGLKRLVDLLNYVPGVQSVTSANGMVGVISARGEQNELSSHILLLIDGQPVTDYVSNSWLYRYANYPLKNVKGVEILHGSASAVHGYNAASAVINIQTVTDLEQASFSIGSHNAQQFNLQDKLSLGPTAINYMFNYQRDKGERYTDLKTITPPWDIKDDRQDGVINSIRDPVERLDASINVNYNSLNYGLAYLQSRVNDYYDFGGFIDQNAINSKWTQTRWHFKQNLNLTEDVSLKYNYTGRYSERERQNLFNAPAADSGLVGFFDLGPEGYLSPNPAILANYPEGLAADAVTNDEVSSVIHEFHTHVQWMIKPSWDMIAGVNAVRGALKKNNLKSNFDLNSLLFLSDPQSVFSEKGFLTDDVEKEEIYSVFLESNQLLNKYWRLNVGLRLDKISSLDTEFSPRLALNYTPTPEHTFKFIYNQAVRSQNKTIYNVYNSQLPDELNIIDYKSYELVYLFDNPRFNVQTSLYRRETDGNIKNLSTSQQLSLAKANSESATGLELSLRANLSERFSLRSSLSQILDIDQNTDIGRTIEPSRLIASLALNYQHEKNNFNINMYHHSSVDHREQVVLDSDYPSITLFNMNHRYQLSDKVEINASVENIFDKEVDAFEEPFSETGARWFPIRGRVFSAGLEYNF